MLDLSSIPTMHLLNKTLLVEFEGETNLVYVQAATDEYLEVIVNPGQGDQEFYAEMYLDETDSFKIIEIVG